MSSAPSRTRQRVALGSLVLAALVALASLGGILLPDAYARETSDWRGQALGQDWFDLVIASPWLVLCAVGTLRGRGHWHLLLAGALLFTIYTFLIYAFAIHFNALFLVYCAALGLSFYLAILLLQSLTPAGERLRATVRTPVRSTGILLIAIGVLFALAWLGEIVPAIAGGRAPDSVAGAGLFTNPVHVIDLAIVLPAHVIAGVALLRRRPGGELFAPVILAFGVPMAASIAGMMVVMRLLGAPAAMPVAAVMLGLAAISAGALARFLARLDPREQHPLPGSGR
jgi:hypothetical protein